MLGLLVLIMRLTAALINPFELWISDMRAQQQQVSTRESGSSPEIRTITREAGDSPEIRRITGRPRHQEQSDDGAY